MAKLSAWEVHHAIEYMAARYGDRVYDLPAAKVVERFQRLTARLEAKAEAAIARALASGVITADDLRVAAAIDLHNPVADIVAQRAERARRALRSRLRVVRSSLGRTRLDRVDMRADLQVVQRSVRRHRAPVIDSRQTRTNAAGRDR